MRRSHRQEEIMPILTRAQQQRAAARQKIQREKLQVRRKKTLVALLRLLGSKEVKDMLPRAKICLGRSKTEGDSLYLKRSGLWREWRVSVTTSEEYGDASYRQVHDRWETRRSKTRLSLELVREFGLTVSKVKQARTRLRAS